MDTAEVEKIVKLAGLSFESNELELFTQKFNDILEYVGRVSEAQTKLIAENENLVTTELSNVFRPDQSTTSLPPEEALSNAPERDQNYFVVPLVVNKS